MMGTEHRASIFRPGAGVQPPVLAGRDKEKEALAAVGRDLRNKSAYKDMQIIGPRGVGKTCLTNWFATELKKPSAHITPCQIRANKIDTTDEFVRAVLRVLPEHILKQLASAVPDQIQVGPSVARFTWTASAYEKNGDDFDEAIANAVKDFPIAVFIDEAHLLKPKVLRDILNLSQFLKADQEVPFVLVLVGTPELQATLERAQATFHERSSQLRLGTLEHKEAIRALAVPFEKADVEFPEQLIGEVVEKTQNYPYFIQLMGEAIEKAIPEGHRRINEEVLEKANRYFDEGALSFCGGRYSELWRNDLEAAAMSVSKLYQRQDGTDILTDWEITDHIETDLEVSRQEAKAMFQRFGDKGFVWDVVPGEYRPGIPSLLTYVVERDRSSRPTGIDRGGR